MHIVSKQNIQSKDKGKFYTILCNLVHNTNIQTQQD